MLTFHYNFVYLSHFWTKKKRKKSLRKETPLYMMMKRKSELSIFVRTFTCTHIRHVHTHSHYFTFFIISRRRNVKFADMRAECPFASLSYVYVYATHIDLKSIFLLQNYLDTDQHKHNDIWETHTHTHTTNIFEEWKFVKVVKSWWMRLRIIFVYYTLLHNIHLIVVRFIHIYSTHMYVHYTCMYI